MEDLDSQLFCDEEFPASDESLYENGRPADLEKMYTWKRPWELCEDPQLFVEGSHPGDVTQGDAGDCWFLSACSALAQFPPLLHRVIPPNQVLHGEGYNGKLTFNFWSMGDWVEIEIDDRLAVYEDDMLKNSSCATKNEFWLPLLEKAFAKFHGNYQIVEGGHLVEGFVNLTGFMVQNLVVEKYDRNQLYRRLTIERKNNSLLTCSRESQYTQGLVGDHGYTITGLKRMRYEGKLLRMIRVRNPWGNQEWTGAWSDGDSRWLSVPKEVRDEFEYSRADDGEFWMKFSHFVKRFLEVCIATPVPELGDFDADGSPKYMFVVHDSWRSGVNAGGCQNDIESFVTNPQYLLTVEEEDDPDSEVEDDGQNVTMNIKNGLENGSSNKQTCRVLIDLIQEHRRKLHRDLYSIALFVIKTRWEKRLTVGDLQETQDVETYTEYDSLSSSFCQVDLPVGQKYVILPATFEPNQERKFLLRVFSHKPVKVRALLE